MEKDAISPQHYQLANGTQVIDLTETLNFNRGNAVKYLARAGRKDPDRELEDLEKAQWYVSREISRLKRNEETPSDTHQPPLTNGATYDPSEVKVYFRDVELINWDTHLDERVYIPTMKGFKHQCSHDAVTGTETPKDRYR